MLDVYVIFIMMIRTVHMLQEFKFTESGKEKGVLITAPHDEPSTKKFSLFARFFPESHSQFMFSP